MLDGELYCHGMSLQQINSRIAVNRLQPHDDAAKIKYYIFDLPYAYPMWQRAKMLDKLRERLAGELNVVVAETHLVNSQQEADYYYALWKEQDFEGLMYRQFASPYGMETNCGNKENRWWYLQKRKDFLDLDAKIVGLNEGEEGFVGMLGSFTCEADSGVLFNAGSGLDFEQRHRYWASPKLVEGAKVKIKYEMLSDGGVPLKPTIESVEENF